MVCRSNESPALGTEQPRQRPAHVVPALGAARLTLAAIPPQTPADQYDSHEGNQCDPQEVQAGLEEPVGHGADHTAPRWAWLPVSAISGQRLFVAWPPTCRDRYVAWADRWPCGPTAKRDQFAAGGLVDRALNRSARRMQLFRKDTDFTDTNSCEPVSVPRVLPRLRAVLIVRVEVSRGPGLCWLVLEQVSAGTGR